MSQQTKVLDLDLLLRGAAGRIRLGGVELDVQHITSAQFHRWRNAPAEEAFAAMLETARVVTPSMTDEQASILTFEIAQAIVTLACAGIDAVEAMFPNVPGLVSPAQPISPA